MTPDLFPAEYLATLSDWRHHVPLLARVFGDNAPATGLELGVCTGTSINLFSRLTPNCHWTGIDAWSEEWGWTNRQPQEGEAFRSSQGKPITLIKGHFLPTCATLQTHSFDVVHVDGEHDWFNVTEDFNLARRMARPSGIILMHDIDFKPSAVPDFWRLVKQRYRTDESHSDCGLGVIYLDKHPAP